MIIVDSDQVLCFVDILKFLSAHFNIASVKDRPNIPAKFLFKWFKGSKEKKSFKSSFPLGPMLNFAPHQWPS